MFQLIKIIDDVEALIFVGKNNGAVTVTIFIRFKKKWYTSSIPDCSLLDLLL